MTMTAKEREWFEIGRTDAKSSKKKWTPTKGWKDSSAAIERVYNKGYKQGRLEQLLVGRSK